jgi:hypothetical protein
MGVTAYCETLKHSHKYHYGQDFHLCFNHSSLTWFLSFKNLKGHMAHWVQHLKGYNFTSQHNQECKHINTDVFSNKVK